MDELLLAAAVLAVVLYFGSPSTPSVLVSTPSPLPPSSPLISFDSGSTSGGYQLTSAATNLANPGGYSPKLASPNTLFTGTFVAPPPVPLPSPWVSGGIAGTSGSGGNPLGSALRPGVSGGTGTTSLNVVFRPVAL